MRFIFVDRILDIQKGKKASMIKNVSASEDYFSLHFPEFPIMPGALMLEALEQAASIFIAHSLDFRAYTRLTKVKNAKFRRIVRPGDQMRLEVALKSLDNNVAEIDGRIRVDGKNTAGMRLTFAIVSDDDARPDRPAAKLKGLFDTLQPEIDSIFS